MSENAENLIRSRCGAYLLAFEKKKIQSQMSFYAEQTGLSLCLE